MCKATSNGYFTKPQRQRSDTLKKKAKISQCTASTKV